MDSTPKLCCSARLVITLCCFFATFNLTYTRVVASFAMVCMVKSSRELYNTSDTNCLSSEESKRSKLYEFAWSSDIQGHLISGVFYGFLVGPFVSGFLCFKYGGKVVLIIGTIVAGASHMFIPELTRIHPQFFFVIRIITGFFAGFILPAFYDILTHWVVPDEQQLLVGFALTGVLVGCIINYPMNGFLCCVFGWVSAFYFSAIWMLTCGFLFCFLLYNYPNQCPYAKEKEVNYITCNAQTKMHNLKIPWRQIFRSIPLYAYVVTHFCVNYCFLTLALALPKFYKDVHHFQIQSNGVASSLPFIGAFISRVLISLFFEKLRRKLKMSKTVLRKVFFGTGLIITSGALFVATRLSYRHRHWVMACFVVSSTALELAITGGYLLSLLDMCPSYTNILTGIFNVFANIAGMMCSLATGFLTDNGTHDEWSIVFYIVITNLLFALVVYETFGTSELLPWGKAEAETPHLMSRHSITY